MLFHDKLYFSFLKRKKKTDFEKNKWNISIYRIFNQAQYTSYSQGDSAVPYSGKPILLDRTRIVDGQDCEFFSSSFSFFFFILWKNLFLKFSVIQPNLLDLNRIFAAHTFILQCFLNSILFLIGNDNQDAYYPRAIEDFVWPNSGGWQGPWYIVIDNQSNGGRVKNYIIF